MIILPKKLHMRYLRLKPLLLANLIVAVIYITAHAATPVTASVAAAKEAPLPLLGKAFDANNSIYLLGSFHLLKPDDYGTNRAFRTISGKPTDTQR
ncbi:MAG: hypothetical protein WKF61_01915 [Luteimonas sp.]